jgi:hypothetical protein
MFRDFFPGMNKVAGTKKHGTRTGMEISSDFVAWIQLSLIPLRSFAYKRKSGCFDTTWRLKTPLLETRGLSCQTYRVGHTSVQ